MPIRTLLSPHYRRRNFEMLGFQPWRRRIVIVEPLARGSNPRYGVQLTSARKLGGPLLAHVPGDQGFEPIKIARYSSAARVRFCLS
jgi:hypothetical protein